MPITYIVVLTYIKPLKDVDEQIPAHIEWLKKVIQMVFFSHPEEECPGMGALL